MGNKVGAWRVNEWWDLREQGLRCSRQQKEEEIRSTGIKALGCGCCPGVRWGGALGTGFWGVTKELGFREVLCGHT